MKKSIIIALCLAAFAVAQPPRKLPLPFDIPARGVNTKTSVFTISNVTFNAEKITIQSAEGTKVDYCFSTTPEDTVVVRGVKTLKCKNRLSAEATQKLIDVYTYVYGRLPADLIELKVED